MNTILKVINTIMIIQSNSTILIQGRTLPTQWRMVLIHVVTSIPTPPILLSRRCSLTSSSLSLFFVFFQCCFKLRIDRFQHSTASGWCLAICNPTMESNSNENKHLQTNTTLLLLPLPLLLLLFLFFVPPNICSKK